MLSKPRMLVCTDFDVTSDNALKAAWEIKKKVGGDIHLIHVSDFHTSWNWSIEDSPTVFEREKFRSNFSDLLKVKMSDQILRCEVDCTSDVYLDSIYFGIMEQVNSSKYDIVFMGHKGDLQNKFSLGGIAFKVTSSSDIPVFVIKQPLRSEMDKVAALVDTENQFSENISAVEELSFIFSSKPVIISFWKNLSFILSEKISINLNHMITSLKEDDKFLITKLLRERIFEVLDDKLRYEVYVEESNQSQLTNEFLSILDSKNINTVVMMRHQKSALQKIFLGSETQRMLERFKGNILVLPPSIK